MQTIHRNGITWHGYYLIHICISYSPENRYQNIFQHVGIYSFKPAVLQKFVSLGPSKNEIESKLEQLRALDAGIKIGITYIENVPISVDTIEDLMFIENIIQKKMREISSFAFLKHLQNTVVNGVMKN